MFGVARCPGAVSASFGGFVGSVQQVYISGWRYAR